MSENHRLPDYLDHIQQAATDARSFVEGLAKDDFLADKRTQQAVIMSGQSPPGFELLQEANLEIGSRLR
ncbi:HepT-like ribonuclease domain-containing protein [Nitrosospira multiformis]|uniref:HepT-like ribonuclease domain-containing protein n=1 Tax=Nitrosospira multiformis TaxID=1231 RepID=UPI0008987C63|nr:hypothetical protein [Nitrosospira multiformis]SEA69008.1 hypothetical protein SAMN05216411_11943 [Nitrosospira multiformis]